MISSEELINYWEEITGNNVEYEPCNDYEGTIIIDFTKDTGISIKQLLTFEVKYDVKIMLIRHQTYGLYIDITGKEVIKT